MKAISLLVKFGVFAAILNVASGTAKDMIMGVMDGAGVNAAHVQMSQLHTKLMEYYQTYNSYPKSFQDLKQFLKQEFDSPLETVLYDPWKRGYLFLTPQVEIWSYGPDQKENTRDDITKPYPPNVRKPYPNSAPAGNRGSR